MARMGSMIVGPVTVLSLGLLAGGLLVRPDRHFLGWSLLAAVLASLAWVAGVYVLLALTAPRELEGPPQFLPLLYTFLTAFAGAVLAGWMRRWSAGSVAG
jgi:hypothetical protein